MTSASDGPERDPAQVLRAGVVGLNMGRTHIRRYREAPGCEVTALCDIDRDRLDAAARTFDVPHAFTDAEELFASGAIDVVSIATPNSLHAPLAIAALRAGLHVLSEKPMATSLNEARAMVAAAKAAGRTLGVHFNQRQKAGLHRLRARVAGGDLGDIYHTRAYWHRRRGIPVRPTFIHRALAGGGAMIDNGVHVLDQVLFLLGHPEPAAVSAQTSSHFADVDAPGAAMDVEDFAVALVRFVDGSTLSLEISWASHHDHPEETVIQLYGTEAGALRRTHNYQESEITLHRRDGERLLSEAIDCAGPQPPSVQADFIDAICHAREPAASAAHGLKTMRIIDAFYESARRGAEVPVEAI